MTTVRLRCPVCSEAITLDDANMHVKPHNYKNMVRTPCYGSHFPVFKYQGEYLIGSIMHQVRRTIPPVDD